MKFLIEKTQNNTVISHTFTLTHLHTLDAQYPEEEKKYTITSYRTDVKFDVWKLI